MALLLCGLSLTPAAAATLLDGSRVGMTYDRPAIGTVQQNIGINLVGTDAPTVWNGAIEFSFTNDTITYTALIQNTWTAQVFNGFVFRDIDGTIPDFTSARISFSSPDPLMTDARLSWDADAVYVNVQGLSFPVDHTFTIELNGGSGAIPEPASWALMIAGFGLVGGALRRRRLHAAAA
jgi:hypothetical protein